MPRTALVPATALAALVALPPAALAMPMGGTFNGHVDTQSAQPMGAAGQVRITKTASGTNAGPGTPLDGAAVRINDMAVLRNGQGRLKGTIVFATPTGSTSSPYTGTVATDAAGRVTAEGEFREVKGKGEFAGLKGRGRFSVAHSSPTDFTGTWQGEFQVPAQKTSRR
ncbi:hypothetical protein [Methylobacterium haplocladii]|uniref:DUF3224 domain-containing protein n=1 Tax=Methylobacterium haplocladii TaxID=1176176 RepID=A0A512IQH6_9HYPH|nr:hypothetical protein [Methylobacterium haplocladii]GEO99925.1 hypothetical protein MHA02_23130 [Methylobacterium haplocladii]GJD85226.1 hypothetical protein HPGCJGGD_3113 [Methylobacterium haplocladii]GLS59639.1 hypothetical protein GCM10007887_23080 [Methylobacterium haplocladii]